MLRKQHEHSRGHAQHDAPRHAQIESRHIQRQAELGLRCCQPFEHAAMCDGQPKKRSNDRVAHEPRLVGEQSHQSAVVILDAGIQAGVGGFDAAAETAPEIQLPAQIEAGGPVRVIVADRSIGRTCRGERARHV